MKAYLLDTNILIGHLQTGGLNNAPLDTDIAISALTETEILRLPGLGEVEIERIGNLLAQYRSIPVDSHIARRAALLGRTKKTKTLDLLIAATAIESGLTLITKNVRDFKSIPGLKMKKEIK